MNETPSQKFNRVADADGREQARKLAKFADNDTRQQTRRAEFADQFAKITARYGGEPRSVRRAIARTLAKRNLRPATAQAA